ncbi:glycosyl hydrolase all-beta [Lucifera butyrica]|uniref:Alpha,alpha-phosphotrehalase n=1 Tax=Lucifera butyrica TaxID=1351585 RepID=A0A498R3S4_9FIRM|nr:alpha,alpha-phosphotrehalase [Lucifera butyrica]VBB05460.1 glycosyl hydrolase all-beta [Lucifera butyrica]
MKNLKEEDWRQSVIYQIYPRSFKSHSNRPAGDLRGIIEKLDYLEFLGIDYIWLTPVYKSPQRDNGYDVSDYYQLDESYGTVADWEELAAEAKRRRIGIIMDIVVNHTSTEHAWFQEAARSRNSACRDFYIWRDRPNNWVSKFGGPAWQYDAATGQYYLHLFDRTQADLNWENPAVREKVYEMMRFWVNKGVSGFRLDVINLISKDREFPDDPDGDGRRFYTDGPRVHDYLQEMHRAVFTSADVLTVGEMSSSSLEHCARYSCPERRELNMTFSFHHLKVDYPQGEKWVKADFDFLALKQILSDWQTGMHREGGWNALFWCNHDQPRVVSRFGDDGRYRVVSAKMLATALHMLQGTPYIYQGEEIGMTNPGFSSIEKYRDVETLQAYAAKIKAGLDPAAVMAAIGQKSRDNARTPMQWDDSPYAGFSAVEPWIAVAPNYKEINVKKSLQDLESVFYHYQRLIELRKTYPVVTEGEYELLLAGHPAVWAYLRKGQGEILLVVNNFFPYAAAVSLPAHAVPDNWQREVLISNYPAMALKSRSLALKPYESVVYRFWQNGA